MNLTVQSRCCVLCDTDTLDSSDHLFFFCPWSKNMLRKIASWCESDFTPSSIQNLYNWLKRMKAGKDKKGFMAAVYGASIYYIWLCRCRKYHNEHMFSAYQIMQIVKREIGSLIAKMLNIKSKCDVMFLKKFSL